MQSNNAQTAEQVAALESVVPVLRKLERLFADETASEIRLLESLVPALKGLQRLVATEKAAADAAARDALRNLVADERLTALEKLVDERRGEFDALDFVGSLRLDSGRDLWADESFHSKTIAWLLNPNESHGAGDYFLKNFLVQTGAPAKICNADWSSASVGLEWFNVADGQRGFLDIHVVNETARAIFAIENKVFSGEHSEQLTRYRRALEVRYPLSDYRHHYVFLSRQGTLPYRKKEWAYWRSAKYAAVHDIVQRMATDSGIIINKDVRAFLRQYATTLRRNIVPDTNIDELARKIYLEHREVIDLIKNNEPDWQADAVQWLKEAVAIRSQWTLDQSNDNFVRFKPSVWEMFESTKSGTGWSGSNALLLFQFRFEDSMPWLDLALSAGSDNVIRENLFNSVKQHPALFQRGDNALKAAWTTLHSEKDYILDDSDYGVGWDDGTTRTKIEAWVKKFAENEFPAMNKVIVNCLREYEAEQNGG